MTLFLLCLPFAWLLIRLTRKLNKNRSIRFRRRQVISEEEIEPKPEVHSGEPVLPCPARYPTRFQKKPDWVIREVIRLSAIMPNAGGREIADAFNRLYGESKGITVGKTWVCEQRKKHRYAILHKRRQLKHRVPRPLPVHHTWAMDMTGLPDTGKQSHNVLGIIDHGSRRLLCLDKLKSKASIVLLKILLHVIEQTGKIPERLKTDNEAVFTSRLFRFGLWWLGIKHERSKPGHPWQNGRIERLFGTLKQKTKGLLFDEEQMQEQLDLFRFW